MSIITIIYAILIFCLLIFFHELGHLLAAKATGVKVNDFSIGMGPKLFKFQKGETQYTLRLIPIGGFCAMEGEDENSNDPRAFNNKPMWAKAIVIVAGSLMNLILAVIILSIVSFSLGTPTTTIETVTDQSPAYEAGILPGDEILKIDGKPISKWEDVIKNIKSKDEKITFSLKRDGSEITIISEIYKDENGVIKVGIIPTSERELKNIGKSLVLGVKATKNIMIMMFDMLHQLFTGKASVNDLTGPVGIVYAVGTTVENGLIYVAYLMALISVNLAIINMLPLPALDGGRLLFLIIRKVAGKKISDEIEGKIHLVGILLLFGLMIFITFKDVNRFIL